MGGGTGAAAFRVCLASGLQLSEGMTEPVSGLVASLGSPEFLACGKHPFNIFRSRTEETTRSCVLSFTTLLPLHDKICRPVKMARSRKCFELSLSLNLESDNHDDSKGGLPAWRAVSV